MTTGTACSVLAVFLERRLRVQDFFWSLGGSKCQKCQGKLRYPPSAFTNNSNLHCQKNQSVELWRICLPPDLTSSSCPLLCSHGSTRCTRRYSANLGTRPKSSALQMKPRPFSNWTPSRRSSTRIGIRVRIRIKIRVRVRVRTRTRTSGGSGSSKSRVLFWSPTSASLRKTVPCG